MTYPEPEFPIGHLVPKRDDEPFTVVAHTRTDTIMAFGDRRLFSDEDAKRTPWFYTLRAPNGREHNTTAGGIRHQERVLSAHQTARRVTGPAVRSTSRPAVNPSV